jgi:hypothetical protein
MADRWHELAALARRQHSYFTLAQAERFGLSAQAVRRALAAGRLESPHRGVFGLAGGPVTWHRRLAAGFLFLGTDVRVSHRAAGVVLRFDAFRNGPLEYLVGRSRHVTRAGLFIHTSRHVPDIDAVNVGMFRVTSPARTIIDLAAVVPKRMLEAAVDSALRDGWTSETYLRQRLQALRASGRSGVRVLDEVLDGRPLGAESYLERVALALFDRAGLPSPKCQVVHRLGGQVVARVDFEFPGTGVIVEVAGHGTHATRRQRQADAQRIAELTLMGNRVFTFTHEDVVERPRYVQNVTRTAVLSGSGDGFDRHANESVARTAGGWVSRSR